MFPYFPLNVARELVSHIHRLTCLPTYKVVLRDDSGNLLEKLTTSVCLCLAESKYSKNKEEELLIRPKICRIPALPELNVSTTPLAPCYNGEPDLR